jgi:2-hydroxychromene-2-carboxylate isomerase
MHRPTLYFDLGSPYAYLAVERAASVLGVEPLLEPVLLGAIFRWRGRGSWSQTTERASRIAEIESRAAAYGLPPVVWPDGWPRDGLRAMRAATWAKREGGGEAFARAALRRQFAAGEDISGVDGLTAIADQVGLPGAGLREAIETDAVKDALKAATSRAYEAGVTGIPSVLVDGAVFYGDDQLERAAAAVRQR